jgi:hypothetical protein
MQFLHYVAGKNRSGKIVAVGFDLTADPEASVTSMKGLMPFEVETMAVEVGSPARLEELKEQFKAHHAQGPWYRPDQSVLDFVAAVEKVDPSIGKSKRVSLDLIHEDFADLEVLVKETGVKGKAKLLRKALRFYSAMHRYKAQGYMIQAVKGGHMIQFPNLESVS